MRRTGFHIPRVLARLIAAALAALALGCHSGTPAAPEGTDILLSFAYREGTQDFATGDFEAIIQARLVDSLSNVPQVGVGVFFIVDSGPGTFFDDFVVTDGGGKARSILSANGATSSNPVTVRVSSGGAMEATLTLDVSSGSASVDFPPEACFTVDTTGTNVLIDVGCTTDDDCEDDADFYSVDWGDGTTDDDLPFSDDTVDHDYANGTYTIEVTVRDCQNLTDTASRTVTVP